MESDPNIDSLFKRYQELQQYVGWTDGDAERLQKVGPLLEPYIGPLIDDFYDEIERHPAARKVITGGQAQIARLKGTLLAWIRELFSGNYDRNYVFRRWKVGRRHVEIGLDQVFANVALSRLRRGIIRALQEHWAGALDELQATLRSINTLLDLDLAKIEDAYQSEYAARQQRADRQRQVADLRTIMDIIPIGIAIAEDPQCLSITANDTLTKLLRMSPGSNMAAGTVAQQQFGWKILRNGKEVPVDQLPMQMAAGRGETVHDLEIDYVFSDGTVINLLAHAAPLRDEHGQPRGAVGVYIDVTERKRAQERLFQTERLAAIGQMMTGLAHESGNALARSQVCLEMLTLQVEDRPKAVELVERIQNAQNHLMQLYEEVRGYAAPLKLELERTSLASVWRQAWGTLELARKGRNICLCEETDGVDLYCSVDSFRLQQLFRNIFDNALAACKDPVEIVVSPKAATLQGKDALRVCIRDNGPGLNPEQRQRIVEPFFTTKTKGTGLGMAIARRIVEAHSGEIAVGDGSGHGAELIITLPRKPS